MEHKHWTTSSHPLLNQFLTAGCDVNCTSDFFSQVDCDYLDGATALIIAATHHANKLVSFLLENGADVTLTNRNGDSALHRACWSGNLEALQKLVEYGAMVDRPNFNGMTPRSDGESVGRSDDRGAGGLSRHRGVFAEAERERGSAGVGAARSIEA